MDDIGNNQRHKLLVQTMSKFEYMMDRYDNEEIDDNVEATIANALYLLVLNELTRQNRMGYLEIYFMIFVMVVVTSSKLAKFQLLSPLPMMT